MRLVQSPERQLPMARAGIVGAMRLGRNPMILAILAGLAVSLIGTRLPSPLSRAIDLFAAASAALSLFVIGGSLVSLPLKGLGRDIAPIAAGKLLLHPLAVGIALWALQALGLPPLEPMLRNALVLMAATPMLSIYPALAQPYRQEHIAAPALLVTTLASFFTLSTVMWLLGHAGH